MIHSITYDLKQPGRNYDDLYQAIKSYSSWAHPLESVWFVDTSSDPRSVCDHLKQYIDSNDILFVVRMSRSWASINLGDDLVNWLNSPTRTW